jgi:hypothetical protein
MEELHKKERHCKAKSHTSLPPKLKLSQMAKRKERKKNRKTQSTRHKTSTITCMPQSSSKATTKTTFYSSRFKEEQRPQGMTKVSAPDFRTPTLPTAQ